MYKHHAFRLTFRYLPTFDLKINVGHSDLLFTVQLLTLYLEEYLEYVSVWPEGWLQNKCMSQWPIFHSPVIFLFILKSISYVSITLSGYLSILSLWRIIDIMIYQVYLPFEVSLISWYIKYIFPLRNHWYHDISSISSLWGIIDIMIYQVYLPFEESLIWYIKYIVQTRGSKVPVWNEAW